MEMTTRERQIAYLATASAREQMIAGEIAARYQKAMNKVIQQLIETPEERERWGKLLGKLGMRMARELERVGWEE